MISCILLAAGSGTRMGREINKVFLPLGQYSVLQRTALQIKSVEAIDELIVVCAAGEIEQVKREIEVLSLGLPIQYCEGGKERQDSVERGLQLVSSHCELVLTHDGARPLASKELFYKVIEGARKYKACAVGVPLKDTVKRVNAKGEIEETPDRKSLMAVQTPQGLSYTLFLEAMAHAKKEHYLGTDDLSLAEFYGQPGLIVPGDYKNIKLTTPEDMIVAKNFLGLESTRMRVGFGYDVHRFKEGRPCILGGVTIDSPIGPDGHSDADVIIHALMDALLGAAGLRDIGYYFPPNDERFYNISSVLLLKEVIKLLKEKDLIPYNVDLMIIAEVPKINPHIPKMKVILSEVLERPEEFISIKATTNEGLGALGRKEGIVAQAVVTITEREA